MSRDEPAYDDGSDWTGWPVPDARTAPRRSGWTSTAPAPAAQRAGAPRSGLDRAWRWLALLGALAAVAAVAWFLAVRGGSSTARVPSVVGLGKADAVSRLTRAGFDVRTVELPLKGVRHGRVVSERPAGGVRLRLGQTVTLRIAR